MADIAPIYLTLLMGPTIPVPVPLQVTDALLTAQVTVTAGQRSDSQKGTALDYLNQLAQANGYVFYLDPGPLPGMSRAYWGPEIRIGIPQPALTVNSDAFSNVEQLTFSFDGTAREQPTARIQ